MRVGFALKAKKVQRYATPAILQLAREQGIVIVILDAAAASLSPPDAPPFDLVLHKLDPSHAFYNALARYRQSHPDTRVIDPPENIARIQDRQAMLQPFVQPYTLHKPAPAAASALHASQATRPCVPSVPSTHPPPSANPAATAAAATAGAALAPRGARCPGLPPLAPNPFTSPGTGAGGAAAPTAVCVAAPKFIVVSKGTPTAEVEGRVTAAGLQFPLLSKPLEADGRLGAHNLMLFVRPDALKWLEDPLTGASDAAVLLQQFEEHDGVLFKVYVMGTDIAFEPRPSLLITETLRRSAADTGVIVLPRFSCTPLAARRGAMAGPAPACPDGDRLLRMPGEESCVASGTEGEEGSGVDCGAWSTPVSSQDDANAYSSDDAAVAAAAAAACSLQESGPLRGDQAGAGCSGGRRQSPDGRFCRTHSLRRMTQSLELQRPRQAVAEDGQRLLAWPAKDGRGRDIELLVPEVSESSVGTVAGVAMPPEWVLQELGRHLRDRLGLSLFNLDVIFPRGHGGSGAPVLHVVDINYFPGFDKLPRFEQRFTAFLRKQCEEGRAVS